MHPGRALPSKAPYHHFGPRYECTQAQKLNLSLCFEHEVQKVHFGSNNLCAYQSEKEKEIENLDVDNILPNFFRRKSIYVCKYGSNMRFSQ